MITISKTALFLIICGSASFGAFIMAICSANRLTREYDESDVERHNT